MKKERRQPRHFDDQFRLSVLKDYYESGVSYGQISRKYDVSSGNVIAWEKKYMNKCVSLPTDIIELEKQVFMAKKARDSRPQQVMSEEEKFHVLNEFTDKLTMLLLKYRYEKLQAEPICCYGS